VDKESASVREARLKLPPEPSSPGVARRFVDRYLRHRCLSADAIETALLVSSELVTNAYRHGEGEIELRVSVRDDRVRIEVIDLGRGEAPSVREQKGDETGGWGLRIVDQLAVQWGVFEGPTHVWADVTLN
jgi:anti-sigma regulatory factor (Ser/Thr protein kinase)